MTNVEIAQLLRKVATAYQILDENRFRIIAYERAADSIEHLIRELKEYWYEKKLDEVPGVGATISQHLDEVFRTGTSRHWEKVFDQIPSGVFPLLLVPGIGPKKAYTLITKLHLGDEKTVVADLEKAANAGKIASLEGFGEKSQSVILEAIESYKKGQIKENRMPLPTADAIAQEIMAYLHAGGKVTRVDVLGSLRRSVSTIGDIDIAVATSHPEHVLTHFLTFPHQKIIDHGESGATLLLHNGRQVDVRVQAPESYGAMLQYFTGSKNHNVRLREFALKKGKSLSEHGMKDVKTGKIKLFTTEKDFYEGVGLKYISPELREDKGEIEAAIHNTLPNLVEISDIRGDLHIHTNYDLSSSHDIGKNTFVEHLSKASEFGYSYIGISDHNPSVSNHSSEDVVAIMRKRKEVYEQQYYSWVQKVHNKINQVQYILMCEVDILPDGNLALPAQAFEYVDAVIVSLHSVFTQEHRVMTDRIIKALTSHPKVRIFGHPTGRLLGSREGVSADWAEIFRVAKERDIALEINAAPERLDLPDQLVYEAVGQGVKLVIDTDAHAVEYMDLMRYGVSVARRGWATKRDIVNTLGYNNFKKWLVKS